MTKSEILAALAQDYKSAHRVFASMQKQAAAFEAKGDTAAYENMKHRAALRYYTLSGIKRAAIALGITETEFMAAVDPLLND